MNEVSVPRRRVIPAPYHQPNVPPPPVESAKLAEPPRVNKMPMEYRPMGVGNLAKGICGVMAEVGTIPKRGYNRFHNYNYVLFEDVLDALAPLMGKHGIAVIQNEIERNLVENRVTVTYEFSIFHTSGEVWPERPRFTGMSGGRDSKGGIDDKAINKCHSAARKYFLMALFQVPAGDFPDADAGPPQTASTKQPIPVVPPRPAPPLSPVQRAAVPGPVPTPSAPAPTKPQKIGLGAGAGPEEWATRYIKCLGEAKTTQELTEWDALNEQALQSLSDKHRAVYDRTVTAYERRMTDLTPPFQAEGVENIAESIDAETGEITDTVLVPVIEMPDPKKDTQAAINWVAQRLYEFNTYPVAEKFWNEFVATRENDFNQLDWEALFTEWQRVETRFGIVP